ncbi:MAG: proton-conducting transporter membrane subunit, partial [Xanthomonadales bacterium]|nr:proton-conducting transporter membrane subunit [Xanthomonadales bacterium]
MMFAALASGLWLINSINSINSIGYMRGNREKNQTRFYVMFAVSLAATMGIAFSANLFTLFLFYEMLTLSTYPLVSHKGDPATVRSARVYLGILISASIGLLLPAIIWTYAVAGTGDFVPGGILEGHIEGPLVGLLLGLFVFGVDFLFAEPSSGWLFYVTAFTIVAASVVALRQQNLKRLLAYSTIAQLSYVVMAAAILKPLAEVGAAIHMLAHAFGKITLFFAAGAIYTAS